MMAEAGLFALILAFALACAQAAGLIRREWQMSRLAGAQCALLTFSLGALMLLRATHDFSVTNVAEHSSRSLPLLYRLAGTWGNHEGSMLLWVWVLSAFGLLLGLSRQRAPDVVATAQAVQGLVGAGFLLFILLTSNPFARLFPPPKDGTELNPLLQDIGLAMHPPVLYGGYVGFSVVFALGVAGLLTGRLDRSWARLAQPWILAAWGCLTLGIGLGSWWAYRELGWGGWWFWDPVENASLLPWLSGTALLHSNLVLMKRGKLAGWVALLAIITFSLSLLGTFLVRSGILTSVHSFASDPERGLFILCYIFGVTGGALLLYALRPPARSPEPLAASSREGMMVANNLFLLTACGSVMLGTLYPMVTEWASGYRITVGPPFFNATFLPLMIPPVILAAVAPFRGWGKTGWKRTFRALRPALGAAAFYAFLVLAVAEREKALGALGIGLAGWLGVGSLLIYKGRLRAFFRLPSGIHAMAAGHLGAALVVAGITGSSLWGAELERPIAPGEAAELAGYRFEYGAEKMDKRANHIAKLGEFSIHRGNKEVAVLHPEYRVYLQGGAKLSETAIHSRPARDVLAVIGESTPEGRTAMRLYLRPMMQCLWAGFALMALGGFLPLAARLRMKMKQA